MLRFQNDYSEGAHPNVLRALCDTNLCSTPGYGLDDDCRRAADAIRARFACPDADVHFLVGGTQTNQLAAAAFLRPWEAIYFLSFICFFVILHRFFCTYRADFALYI